MFEDSTTEKIKKITDSLIESDSDLAMILGKAGRDSETQYTVRYLNLLADVKTLQVALHKLLWEDYCDVWKEVDYAAGGFMPTKPIRKSQIANQPALDAIADKLPPENEMGKGKIDIRNIKMSDCSRMAGLDNIPLPEVKK